MFFIDISVFEKQIQNVECVLRLKLGSGKTLPEVSFVYLLSFINILVNKKL